MKNLRTLPFIILIAAMMIASFASAEPARLRVMSYNIHIGKGTDGELNLRRIASVILAAKPDIVALQEVDKKTRRSGGVDEAAELARLTGMHAVFGEAMPFDGGQYGQALLSRFPINDYQVYKLPGEPEQEPRIAIAAEIEVGSNIPELLFVGTHFDHQSRPTRLRQASILSELLAQRGHPNVVLAGDLNAAPSSPEMKQLLADWRDTTGDDALSFPAGQPDRKIDWILIPKNQPWEVVSSRVIPEAVASDHRPIIVEFEIPVTDRELVPPVLVQREANKWPEPPAGTVVELDAPTSTTFSLFIPQNVEFNSDGSTMLTIHFHGAAWFIQQEHARRGATHPLLTGNASAGDAVFETDIMQEGVMESLIAQVEDKLNEATSRTSARIGAIELSGFSAGYAGVRGVLRLPEFEPMVKRVLLNDSVYVGDGPDSIKPDNRKPRGGEGGIQPFIDFARKAAAGERELLMEFSSTPSMGSVGPMDCARAVIAALGIQTQEVPLNSIPAALESADYQLMWRADRGNAHFWCYRAAERPIHLAHVRNQAEMWRALDGKTTIEAQPPLMLPRAIKPSVPEAATIPIDIGTSGTVSLHIPANYKVPASGEVELSVHFHGATWFAIQEHMRRGNGDPIVAVELGQGSNVYRIPFEDRDRFALLLKRVEEALRERGVPEGTHVSAVNITSFSAGYGAVREIVKSPEYVALIRRIVLADSSYGSLDEEQLALGRRVVATEHVEPWANFAKHALAGEKTLLMLTSDITPESYAGTHEVARAVATALGLEITPVEKDPGLPYPLHTRADSGMFHWWAYGGEDAVVHMTIARHVADAWEALDQVGDW